MPTPHGVKKMRDTLNRPGFIYMPGILDLCTTRMSETLIGLDDMYKVERDTVEKQP